MIRKYKSYVMLGVIAMSVLLLSASPIMAGTLTINTNPSGATVTLGGKSLGVTPVSINPATYPSPSFLRLEKSGYQPMNLVIYSWMTGSTPTYNLKPSSTTGPAPTPTPKSTPSPTPTPKSTPAPAPTPKSTPAPAPAPKTGTLIDSRPQGAAVYVYLGVNNGEYLGTTPFNYDFSAMGPTYIQFVKTGYKFTWTKVYPSYGAVVTTLNS